MFEDFDNAKEAGGRKRMGVSMAISSVLFAIVALGITAAIATAHAVMGPKEPDIPVEFASIDIPPPPPQAPDPQIRTPRTRRKAAKNRNLQPPTTIPDERPEEAEGQLVEAGDTGPLEGFTDGTEDGEGTGPYVEVEDVDPNPGRRPTKSTVRKPRFVAGCHAPKIPTTLHGQAATIRIEIRVLVDADGRVTHATVLQSHPLIDDALVLGCAQQQQFEPAQLPDGTPIPYPFRRRFIFRPTTA